MIIDFEHHLFLGEQLRKGRSKSGKICERYWDASGKMKIHVSEEASHVDRYIQYGWS